MRPLREREPLGAIYGVRRQHLLCEARLEIYLRILFNELSVKRNVVIGSIQLANEIMCVSSRNGSLVICSTCAITERD